MTERNANVIAALTDFLHEMESRVLTPTGRYTTYCDGHPIVVDVVIAQQALARLRGQP
jgi:hypothetical protein